jgi:hypothetical protein
VQLKGHTADEVTKVIRAADDVRVLCRCGATHGDSPTMGVLTRRVGFAFFGGQNDGSVSINYGSVYRKALKKRDSRVREVVSRGRYIPLLGCGLWT